MMKVHIASLASLGLEVDEPRSRYRGARRSTSAVDTNPGLEDIAAVRVPYSAIETLAARLGVSTESLIAIIGMTPRTAARRKLEASLKPDESDRLFRVVRVFDEARRVLGSGDKAAAWLRAPHPMFWQHAPLRLLDSDAGAKAVTDELTRIDFGDFA